MPQTAKSALPAMKKDLPAVEWLKVVRFDLEQALNCTIIPLPPGQNSFFITKLFLKTEEQAYKSLGVCAGAGNRKPNGYSVLHNCPGRE